MGKSQHCCSLLTPHEKIPFATPRCLRRTNEKNFQNLSLEWNGNVTCFQTSQQWAQFPQVCKPPLQGRFPSWNYILQDNNNKLIIHIPYIFKLTKTKGESNCQTSFDAINLYILYLSTTSCQYWVAKPIRAQQEEKSATHLHQIILGSGKSTKRENGQTETVNGQTVKSNLHAQKPWPWHLGKRMKC